MSAYRVGLTGGIGSGKSTVARLFQERGAVVIDADRIARDVVEPGTPGLAAIVDSFGSHVLAADGSLDRQALADIAFATDVARERLNSILHPLITAQTAACFAKAQPEQVVVHDVALLTELGLAPGYQHIVVVDCPDELRIERLIGRGLDRADAVARMSAQATREQRLAIADIVIENHGSESELEVVADRVWNELSAAARSEVQKLSSSVAVTWGCPRFPERASFVGSFPLRSGGERRTESRL